jgi:hypothetical protein
MKIERKFSADGKRCTHVVVHHTGTAPEQNFSDRLVDAAVSEGWIVISGDQLQMKTDGEPLRYQLLRRPGYFCKSSGESIPIGVEAWLRFRLANDSRQSRAEALAWLAAHGKASDDYDITTAYHCVLDAAQHARHRAVSEGGIVRRADETAGV